ncbi:MAG TPA: DUF3025 domain-containing protein [Burkholderiales bacterium]|nr:DUF3025 domain-containing protein [Burkholderiales bacterium]
MSLHLSWDPRFDQRSPAFAPLEGALAALQRSHWPERHALQERIDRQGIVTASGASLRLVAPASRPAGDRKPYELRVFEDGEVGHRDENWHDLFNALVWLTFPAAKAALNARHVREMAAQRPGRRGPVRDALTLFDEDGMLVLSTQESILQLVRGFRWKELFWQRRTEVQAHARFVVFGHALYHKALTPFVGMVGRALLMPVDSGLFSRPLEEQIACLDARLTPILSAGLRSPADLQPLPLLGIPGWFEHGEREAFYDDREYFRPGRRAA